MRREIKTIQDAGLAVVHKLRKHGYEALWAGGCVRDMLMNLPAHDIDVATNAPPSAVLKMFPHTRHVGAQFGVVLVRQGSYWIETATFRTDLDYIDGRRPERVEFTTADHDAQRRDFTINGLFFDPIEDKVIDYVGGQKDLADGVIRAIGEPAARFAEDHLRMLRAVRFATRFGFVIEESTAVAIRRHAAKLKKISPERIREELEKMFIVPSRGHSLALIAEVGLFPYLWQVNVSPSAQGKRPSHTFTPTAWSADRMRHTVDVLAILPENADFTLSLAALLHEDPPENASLIASALRCSTEQIDHTFWLITNHSTLEQSATLSLASFKKLAAHSRFNDLLVLHKAICVVGGRPLDGWEHAYQRRQSIPDDEITPPPLVTGSDLIDLGLSPGPSYKRILSALYDAQLDGELTHRDQALERLRKMVSASFPMDE